MSKNEGRFVWWDLMSTDVARSAEFFTGLFGWTVYEQEMGGEVHRFFKNGDNGFGGIEPVRQAGQPSAWVGYIETPDIARTLATVERLGGAVLMPTMALPEVGHIAIITDPQGAALALYQQDAANADWVKPAAGVGDFDWAELGTSDVEGAQGFYGECFNWGRGPSMPMDNGDYHMFAVGEAPVAGLFSKSPEMPVSAWIHYVNVDDVDATIAKAKALGGTVLVSEVVPGMVHFALMQDPTGATFGVAKDISDC